MLNGPIAEIRAAILQSKSVPTFIHMLGNAKFQVRKEVSAVLIALAKHGVFPLVLICPC